MVAQMVPVRVTLHLLICCTAALKVSSCVCYVGQEPHQATGKRYGWSLAEQAPCECIEFRLGGVNIKPQVKLHEVKIGDNPRVSVDEQGHIVLSNDCKEDQPDSTSTESTASVTSCSSEIFQFKTLTSQERMDSPIRLTFIVQEGAKYVSVDFSTGDSQFAQYEIYLGPQSAEFKVQSNPSESPKEVEGLPAHCIGVPVTITYNDGHFKVTIAERAEPSLTHDVITTPETSWFVTFRSGNEVDMTLFEPCNSDFKAN